MPRAWAGFMENVHQTPFLTGLRLAHWQEMAKILRTVPGILVVAVLLPLSWFKQQHDFESDAGRRYEIVLLAALLPAIGILIASLTIIAPNTVAIANYLQPMIVACYLGSCAMLFAASRTPLVASPDCLPCGGDAALLGARGGFDHMVRCLRGGCGLLGGGAARRTGIDRPHPRATPS